MRRATKHADIIYKLFHLLTKTIHHTITAQKRKEKKRKKKQENTLYATLASFFISRRAKSDVKETERERERQQISNASHLLQRTVRNGGKGRSRMIVGYN